MLCKTAPASARSRSNTFHVFSSHKKKRVSPLLFGRYVTVLLAGVKRVFVSKTPRFRHYALCRLALEQKTRLRLVCSRHVKKERISPLLIWAIRDSNTWPPQCRCDALPTALIARIIIKFSNIYLFFNKNFVFVRCDATSPRTWHLVTFFTLWNSFN